MRERERMNEKMMALMMMNVYLLALLCISSHVLVVRRKEDRRTDVYIKTGTHSATLIII